MQNNLILAIIKELLRQNNYISAQCLADSLHVSRRTIFNNLERVQRICENYNAKLISQKSRGYKIQNTYDLELYIKRQNIQYNHTSNQEKKLYIIYLLLSDEEPIHISELEEIMFLSRPTIYKLIDELTVWFQEVEIKLNITRKGISIIYGERRYRQALKNWMIETMRLIDGKLKNKDTSDFFKLKKCLKKYLIKDMDLMYRSTEIICDICQIHLSKKEIENIGVLLNVITYRVIEGYYVEESKRLIGIIDNLYTSNTIDKVRESLNSDLSITLSSSEIIYFIVNLLVNGDFKDRNLISTRMKNIKINKVLMREVEEYLRKQLNIEEDLMQKLLLEIQYIIKRELLFLIKGNAGSSAKHYDVVIQNFRSTVVLSKHLYQMICKYYYIIYYEKMLCNLNFTLLYFIQKSKKNLVTAWIHDCDEFEYRYVLSNLHQLPFISLIYITDKYNEFEKFIETKPIDLVFSTIGYKNGNVDIIEISKVFGSDEMLEVVKKLKEKYESVNFSRIMKGMNITYSNRDFYGNL